MSFKTNLSTNDSEARFALERIDRGLSSPAERKQFAQAVGRKGEQMLRRHFLAKNKKPNKKGYPKSNFWARIRTATALAKAEPGRATIAISDPAFATHLYGATIRPKKAKFLTIPIAPESYGKRVAEMEDPSIFFLRSKRGKAFLARPNADGSVRLLYFLTRQVKVPKDPAALPPQGKFERGLLDTAESYAERLTR